MSQSTLWIVDIMIGSSISTLPHTSLPTSTVTLPHLVLWFPESFPFIFDCFNFLALLISSISFPKQLFSLWTSFHRSSSSSDDRGSTYTHGSPNTLNLSCVDTL